MAGAARETMNGLEVHFGACMSKRYESKTAHKFLVRWPPRPSDDRVTRGPPHKEGTEKKEITPQETVDKTQARLCKFYLGGVQGSPF